MRKLFAALVLAGLMASLVGAQDEKAKKQDPSKKEKPGVTLKVGDAAPELKATKWLQGDEVKSFEKDKVYVVEFWATWCGPCIVMMPHLSELQQEYKSIVGPSGEREVERRPRRPTPCAARGALPGSDEWFVVTMTPGRHPVEELEAALLRVATQPPAGLLEQLGDGPGGLAAPSAGSCPTNDHGCCSSSISSRSCSPRPRHRSPTTSSTPWPPRSPTSRAGCRSS